MEIQNLLREQQNVSQQNKQLSTYIDEANSDCRKLSADIMRLEESKATLADEVSGSADPLLLDGCLAHDALPSRLFIVSPLKCG